MMIPHKHASVLRAIAAGREVQWRSLADGHWCDVHPQATVNPCIDTHLEWRVKPTGDVLRAAHLSLRNGHVVFYPGVSEDSNVALLFDGETGNLKSVEVVK